MLARKVLRILLNDIPSLVAFISILPAHFGFSTWNEVACQHIVLPNLTLFHFLHSFASILTTLIDQLATLFHNVRRRIYL